MSEKKDNPEEKRKLPTDGTSAKNAEESAEENAAANEEALADIDLVLSEEDPEFLKEIEQIQIDAAIVSLSIMDEAIESINEDFKASSGLRFHLRNVFNIAANPKKVIILWILIFSAIAGVFYMTVILNRIFTDKLFLHSFVEIGDEVKSYNPLTETEPLYDNQRFAKNLVTMAKMLTNVKASENSGPNPMLALELNVEGTSAEAIIELKDREAEFKDILLRQTEEFSYDQLDSADGKRELLDKFRTALNSNLTQGQVRRVLLRSFILKH
ncbi:MAG: flagellar basal body-associated FliL family protein [Pseudobdellovibrio sp.]